jgi:hypothetical protein
MTAFSAADFVMVKLSSVASKDGSSAVSSQRGLTGATRPG